MGKLEKVSEVFVEEWGDNLMDGVMEGMVTEFFYESGCRTLSCRDQDISSTEY